MIVDFRAQNYRSIKDELILSFEADQDKQMADVLIHDERRPHSRLVPTVLLYGGNASGKSNICRALRTLAIVATQTATMLNRDDAIPGIVPFRLCAACLDQPSRFGLQLLIKGDYWDYEIAADSSQIHFERLRRKANTSKARWAEVFVRSGANRSQWVGNAPRLNKTFFDSVRENATILSKAASENIAAVLPVFDEIASIHYRRLADPLHDVVREALASSEGNPTIYALLAKLVSCADIPVDTIELKSDEVSLEELRSLLEPGSATELPLSSPQSLFGLAAATNLIRHSLKFSLKRDDGAAVNFDVADLSDGTTRFLALMLNIVQALKEGSLLVMDEFDASLHPILAARVREIINDPDLNPKGAQFIAATHNDALLESYDLRPDQVVMVVRNKQLATECYALSELSPRPKANEPYRKRYLIGGFGGVPKVADLRAVLLEEVRGKIGA